MNQALSQLSVGDAVRDERNADDDDRGRMRVLAVTDEWADERTIDADGTTVADVNAGPLAGDQVVEVVFERDLDRRVPSWEEWDAGELPERLAAYQSEWGVDVRSYAFPRGRLEVAR